MAKWRDGINVVVQIPDDAITWIEELACQHHYDDPYDPSYGYGNHDSTIEDRIVGLKGEYAIIVELYEQDRDWLLVAGRDPDFEYQGCRFEIKSTSHFDGHFPRDPNTTHRSADIGALAVVLDNYILLPGWFKESSFASLSEPFLARGRWLVGIGQQNLTRWWQCSS